MGFTQTYMASLKPRGRASEKHKAQADIEHTPRFADEGFVKLGVPSALGQGFLSH